MKAVFDTKPTSIYDDDVSGHYQFPRRYLATVERCVSDWIVLRRPRADGGNLAYFATARVAEIEADPKSAAMSYAHLSDFLPFDKPVPWLANGRYAEEALRNIPRREVGVYMRGRSVRSLSEADFSDLIALGLSETLNVANADRLDVPPSVVAQAAEQVHTVLPAERNRQVESVLTNRIIRDANFRRSVCIAYDDRCAVTRLRIIDGNGKSEVQAAHIGRREGRARCRPNWIALSATVHWLFDRYLISITDDYRLLVADRKVPSEFQTLLAQHGAKIGLPTDRKDWPHPRYLAKHRRSSKEKQELRRSI